MSNMQLRVFQSSFSNYIQNLKINQNIFQCPKVPGLPWELKTLQLKPDWSNLSNLLEGVASLYVIKQAHHSTTDIRENIPWFPVFTIYLVILHWQNYLDPTAELFQYFCNLQMILILIILSITVNFVNLNVPSVYLKDIYEYFKLYHCNGEV